MQQCGVNDAENRCRGSDAQRNRQDGDGREAGRRAQHAHCEANVLPEMIPPERAAGFVEALFGLHEVAEGATSGGPSLLFAQPQLPQARYLELYMGFDFGGKVAEFAFSSEHGISLPRPPARELARWPLSSASTDWFLARVVCGRRLPGAGARDKGPCARRAALCPTFPGWRARSLVRVAIQKSACGGSQGPVCPLAIPIVFVRLGLTFYPSMPRVWVKCQPHNSLTRSG